METTYTYNATTGLLSSIADVAGTTPYTYNAAGKLATMDDPFNTGTKKSCPESSFLDTFGLR